MAGKVKRASAPRVRMAAMAVEVSSSSGSMAPCAAMMAVTPQMELPMASRLVSLGGSLKMRPRSVITVSERMSSMATSTQAHAADVEDVREDELGADQDDAELEPELIGGDAGAEDGGDGEDVGDEEAEDDGPEDVLDVREVVDVARGVDAEGLEAFAGNADGEEQQRSRQQREPLRSAVDDVEADECGEDQGDGNGCSVDVEGQPGLRPGFWFGVGGSHGELLCDEVLVWGWDAGSEKRKPTLPGAVRGCLS
jgi:hypothetical protein